MTSLAQNYKAIHVRLVDILELFQMKQVITDATRITRNTDSLLDIIATNRPDKVKEVACFT